MPAPAFLRQAGLGELQAELRLADPGRADHDGQRAGQQPAAQESRRVRRCRWKAAAVVTIMAERKADFRIPLSAQNTRPGPRRRPPARCR